MDKDTQRLTYPDGVLLGGLHGDVLVQNVADAGLVAHRRGVVPARLHVDALVGVGHDRVAEGDVVHICASD